MLEEKKACKWGFELWLSPVDLENAFGYLDADLQMYRDVQDPKTFENSVEFPNPSKHPQRPKFRNAKTFQLFAQPFPFGLLSRRVALCFESVE